MGTLVILKQVSLRDSETESGWVFLAFSLCLRIMSQRWPCHNSRKLSIAQCTAELGKGWGAPRGLTTMPMSSVTSQGLCSRYITCNFQFWSSLCSSEWAITKAGWPANFSYIITFLWWISGKLRASAGLLSPTHHTQSPALQVPFVKGLVSLSGHFPSRSQTVGQELPWLFFVLQMTSQSPGSQLTKWTG